MIVPETEGRPTSESATCIRPKRVLIGEFARNGMHLSHEADQYLFGDHIAFMRFTKEASLAGSA
jgi:hypothetical protein